jgi:hypothetical protein
MGGIATQLNINGNGNGRTATISPHPLLTLGLSPKVKAYLFSLSFTTSILMST